MSTQVAEEKVILDETVEATPFEEKAPKPKNWAMALVTGSTPELSIETDDLLRRRMRSASIILFAGFLAFLVRELFALRLYTTAFDWTLLGVHVLVTLVCGLIGLRLCNDCPHILRHLRKAELLVFGGPALFFVLVSYSMLVTAAQDGYVTRIGSIWLMLIFTYALFIPNTPRRATAIIVPLAAAPILVLLAVAITEEPFRELLFSGQMRGGSIMETGMIMALAAVTAIWGVRTIGTLRREAFAAKQLGQYRLKNPIGEGGMGEVYLAEHMLLKRPCAIKLIRPDKAGDSRVLARFEREVKQTAKLTHWNTIEIYDYGRAEDGTFYYVMEYLPGLNLGQLVEICGPLPTERVIHLLTQTCDALAEAHQQGLIHRDIKPANIFAAKRGSVYDVAKLLDFGLAKPTFNAPDVAITMEGTVTGSPLFMSPEQATGETEADIRSDIYSLGVVAYYLLSGQTPFNSNKPLQVMMAHARDVPPSPATHNPAIPADIEQIVMRCLEKDPDRRFQDVESLREALSACRDAGLWTREMATNWWECHGCPHKKALDEAVMKASHG